MQKAQQEGMRYPVRLWKGNNMKLFNVFIVARYERKMQMVDKDRLEEVLSIILSNRYGMEIKVKVVNNEKK